MSATPLHDYGEQNEVASGPFTSFVWTWPNQPAIGDRLLIAAISNAFPTSSSTTISASDNGTTGNTYTPRDANYLGYENIVLLDCTVTHLPASGALKTTISMSQAAYLMFNPVHWDGTVVGAYDKGAGAATDTLSGTSFPIGPTSTLAQANSLAISGYSCNSAGDPAGITIPSGWTQHFLEQDDNDYIASGAAYEVVSSTAGITATWGTATGGSPNGNVGFVSVFKLLASGASASASQTEVAATQTATGTGKIAAAATQTASAGTQSAAGTVKVAATAAQTGAAGTQTATGAGKIAATASQTGAAGTQVATGAMKAGSAVASQTSAAGTQTATGAVKVAAVASQTATAGTQTATAAHGGANAVASQTEIAGTMAATGVVKIAATASQAGTSGTQTATAAHPGALSAVAAQTEIAGTQAATAVRKAAASAAQAMLAGTQVATATLGALQAVANAVANQTEIAATQAATAIAIIRASAAQTMASGTQVAHCAMNVAQIRTPRTLDAVAENRVLADPSIEDRVLIAPAENRMLVVS